MESQSWAPVDSLMLDREQVIYLPRRMKAASQLGQAQAPGTRSSHQVSGLQSPRAQNWDTSGLCFCVTTNSGLSYLLFLSCVAATKIYMTTEQCLI